ncbi:M23 family metallopeptidase [Chitinispirillales bacterium ANBcel5]|uniref:M23 family metallopeptidase n=1 Tax=Cellulosispirillum alkaliphilum TaxID=3039283 RepID=UPI002A535460|nr:M23 family metallopeptidase [Chitinispirillales bacterium ANBcel5]
MKKKKSHYTLMFIPDGNGRTFSLSLHRYIVISLLVFFILFLTSLIVLLYKTGEIGLKLQLVSTLKTENKRLVEENEQMRLSNEKIATIEYLTSYLHRLASHADLDLTSEDKSLTINANQEIPVSGRIRNTRSPITTTREGFTTSVNYNGSSIPNILPVDGWITRRFSDTGKVHKGIDFAAATGTPIRSTAPGIVKEVKNDKYFGLMVTIKHDFGFVTKYGHCSQILVSDRDRVNRGQTIALVGNTGLSTAPHLHYELLKDGKHINPEDYLIGKKEPLVNGQRK